MIIRDLPTKALETFFDRAYKENRANFLDILKSEIYSGKLKIIAD